MELPRQLSLLLGGRLKKITISNEEKDSANLIFAQFNVFVAVDF